MSIDEQIKQKNKEISALLETRTMSVSKLINYLHKEFDKEGMSKKCSEKGFDDPDSKYYQMTPEMILESWEAKSNESKRAGSQMDNYIEAVLTGTPEDLEKWKFDHNYDYDVKLRNKCLGFDQFYDMLKEKTDYEYCCREQKMYILSNKSNEWINGRFDCLFYSPSLNKYMLIDWKTTTSIAKENSYEKMFGPLYDKDACNLNEYTIQLQMYKKALCEVYKITSPENIDIYVCQFLEEPNANGNNYQLWKEGFEYNSELLDNVIEYSYKKSRMV